MNDNRPGLPALSYRIGTHPTFLARMLANLTTQTIPSGPNAGGRPLAALTTRSPQDPTVALLDAWAGVADVLTFYQERVANEGFLRTATERQSVAELARAIGYEPSPGVAAGAYLAFTVDDKYSATVTIPSGTQVQSLPASGQLPQTFETVAELHAQAAYNAMAPQTTTVQTLATGATELYLAGTATQLQPGDAILIVGDERRASSGSTAWDLRLLQSVETNAAKDYTRVTWEVGLSGAAAATNPKVYAMRQRAAFFGYNAPEWLSMPATWRSEYWYAITGDPYPFTAAMQILAMASMPGGNKPTAIGNQAASEAAKYKFVLGDGDPISGHNSDPEDWPYFTINPQATRIDLDTPYNKVVAGGWLVVAPNSTGNQVAELFHLARAYGAARAQYGVSGKTTRLILDKQINAFASKADASRLDRRTTALYVQSEELALANRPLTVQSGGRWVVTAPVRGNTIPLQQRVDGLAADRALAITGARVRALIVAPGLKLAPDDSATQPISLTPGRTLLSLGAPQDNGDSTYTWSLQDENGVTGTLKASMTQIRPAPAEGGDAIVSEIVLLGDSTVSTGRTTLALGSTLANWYDPAATAVSANVAPATHGETVTETLGSGDTTATHQNFSLKKVPLTYISASSSPTGAAATLQVRVEERLWLEATTLYGLGGNDERYAVRINSSDGKARVIFGDGRSGARLPTGQATITATYRAGLGAAGNVGAESLTLLQTRPLGVRSVSNPVAASGGTDPESLADARTNAPGKMLSLDRIVSLQDVADFARAFAGIGKAQAREVWAGERRLVHLTVAGSDGAAVAEASQVYLSLLAAYKQFGDPTLRVRIDSYTPRTFGLDARVIVDSAYVAKQVLAAVAAALALAFAFGERSFGQPVTAAEVMTVAQGVTGVVAVELSRLALDGAPYVNFVPALLPARTAGWDHGQVAPAELLLLNPNDVSLTKG